jgi:sugar phosphate isomerase/epimerase
MKLGVMSALFADWKLDDVLKYCAELGLGMIELPVGGYPGAPFFDPRQLLDSPQQQSDLKARLAAHGLEVSGLAVHGNPVHPDQDHARRDHEAFETAVRLAPHLDCSIVITFSGCPGGGPGDATPNWVTCAWPPDYQSVLQYQWDKVLVPYWSRQATFAREHAAKIEWEAHPPS